MKPFCLVLLALLSYQASSAASILAGSTELSLVYGSPDTYIHRIFLYNDCSGSDAPDSLHVHYQCLSDPSKTFSLYAQILNSYYNYFTFNCLYTACTCNGGSGFGCEKLAYQTFVTLDTLEKWKIYTRLFGRGATNSCITGPTDYFYLEAIMDLRLAPSNSPPFFVNSIGLFYAPSFYCFNQGIIDADGDSLSYSLVPPLSDSTTEIPYVYPYSPGNFISSQIPVNIDPLSGTICIQPSSDFKGITKVKIEEWRNIDGIPTLIGTSQNDIFLYAKTVVNSTPVLSGFDFQFKQYFDPADSVFTIPCFANDTLRFRIHAWDADSGHNAVCHNANNLDLEIASISNPLLYGKIIAQHYQDNAFADFTMVTDSSFLTTAPIEFVLRVRDHWGYLLESGSDTFRYRLDMIEPVSIKEVENRTSIYCYPNPFSDELTIEFGNIIRHAEICIYDLKGYKVKQIEILNSQRISLETSEWNNGLYVIEVRGFDTGCCYKLIKL